MLYPLSLAEADLNSYLSRSTQLFLEGVAGTQERTQKTARFNPKPLPGSAVLRVKRFFISTLRREKRPPPVTGAVPCKIVSRIMKRLHPRRDSCAERIAEADVEQCIKVFKHKAGNAGALVAVSD